MIKDKIDQILNWHREDIVQDQMQAVTLLRAEFAQLQSAEARNEFFEAIETAFSSEPLPSKSEQGKHHVHLILMYLWAADGPIKKLVSAVFTRFKKDDLEIQRRWVGCVYPSFSFLLIQHSLRFDEAARTTIRDWCAKHQDSELEEIRSTVADLTKTTKFVEYEQYKRKLLGKKMVAVALPSLADLPNRDTLFKDLQEYIVEGVVCSAIYIDLDGFKELNDHIGHLAGDTCLENTTLRIGRVIVWKGTLYRPGGDEFVVVLPNFEIHEAEATAERIRSLIHQVYEPGDLVVSASVGVACSDHLEMKDAQKLVSVADEAMRISKFTGKNRVTAFPPSAELVKAAEENGMKGPR